jgi:DNA sulfur modification protein DndC
MPPARRSKPIYVVSSDTLVENPRVAAWLDRCHDELRQVAEQHSLPVTVHKVTPDPDETFWACLIGRGYPAPTSDFRWCTSRLKIDPAEAWVRENVDPAGRIVQLLGSRRKESRRREASIEAHAIEGKFGTTGSLTEGISYQPIQEWDNDNVWEYLRLFDKPWGGNNEELFQLYQSAHGGECVLDFDRRTASCGGSRFGCWTCTVVPEDTSMTNMVAMDSPEFLPLLQFRRKIIDYRNDWSKRELKGRNGYYRFMASMPDEQGTPMYGPFITPGPYRLDVRAELLADLFRIERSLPGFRTVTDNDLQWLRYHWERDYGAGALVDRVRVEVLGAAA